MPAVHMSTARTELTDATAAAEELLCRLGSAEPKLAVVFASRERDQAALNRALRERLPRHTRLFGATTAGEIDNQGMHAGSVVLAGLQGDFDVGLGVGRGLAKDAYSAGSAAITQACSELGTRPSSIEPRDYVGMVFDDGFRQKKEEFLLGMLEQNQGLTLVGGGASDHRHDPARDPGGVNGLVHVDGEVHADSVAIALFRTRAPWAALRSHWYEPTGERVLITKVDQVHRLVQEIDGQPAAKRYADLIGVSVEELPFGMPRGFSFRPTALKVGREYFIRAAGAPLPDGSIAFANLIEPGVELELMRMGDPVKATRSFFENELPARVRSPRAALFAHCGARAWMSHAMGFASELSSTFAAAPPCVGLNAYFETYCGFHINTTLTTLAFGASE